MNVAIFGGGIAGLTVAHELLLRGFNISLFEKEDILGGMARSRIEKSGYPSEHSWRGYGPFYKNFFDMIQQIPNAQHFSETLQFELYKDKKDIKSLTIFDRIFIIYYAVKIWVSDKRREYYYSQKLMDTFHVLSEGAFDKLVEFGLGPGLGLDRETTSIVHPFIPQIISREVLNERE